MPNRIALQRPASARRRLVPACISCARRRHPGTLAALAFGSLCLLAGTGLAASPVTVTHPWFRYLMPQVPAGGYMTLNNASSQPLVLTGARSPACGTTMLHRTEQSGGMDRMVAAGKVTVPAQGTFQFAPGGYHIMCMHPAMHVGESVPVTLVFADGSKLEVPFPVYGAGGPPNSAPTGAATTTRMKMPM
ncbi:MAG: copper chaperone PCu(A)C [Acetobacteraceae bacterium]